MTISTEIEIPELLHTQVQNFIDTYSLWSEEQVIAAALELFLLTQSHEHREISK